MTNPIYATSSLIGLVANLRHRSSFILDTFFGGYVGPTGSEEIVFDIEDDILGVAPFVMPLVAGKPMRERGFESRSFKPAYVKPKMALDPSAPLVRQYGEEISGNLSAAEREAAQVAHGMNDLINAIYRRMELMACETISTSTLKVMGEGYSEPKFVDFGRKPEFTRALIGGDAWGETGVSPIRMLEDWIHEVAEASGVSPDKVVMTRDAFQLFREDEFFDKMVDTTARGSTASLDPSLTRDVSQGTLQGTLGAGGPEIWVYNAIYQDEKGNIQRNLKPHTVILGSSRPEANQTRHFGTIIDPNLNYESTQFVDPDTGTIMDFAPRTWLTDDPGQRWLMVQCAPLTALNRPNATFCATVR